MHILLSFLGNFHSFGIARRKQTPCSTILVTDRIDGVVKQLIRVVHVRALFAACVRTFDSKLTRFVLVSVREGRRLIHCVHLWTELLP